MFGKEFGDLTEGFAAIFKCHWSVFWDVNFEYWIAFGEDAIPVRTREADRLVLCVAVGVYGVADDMGRGFDAFGCPGLWIFPSARAVEVAVGAKFQSGFAQETYLRRGAMAVGAHFLTKGSYFVLQASYAIEVAVEMAEQPGQDARTQSPCAGDTRVKETTVFEDADVVVLLRPDVRVAAGQSGDVFGYVARLVVGAELWYTRERDEEIKGAAVIAEYGGEEGPVAGCRVLGAFGDEEEAMGMPGHVREVGICGDFLSGADCEVYGVWWKICPVAIFADGFGLKKGEVAGEGCRRIFPNGCRGPCFLEWE